MRFVADEGVERFVVDRLRADGHEVLYILEAGPGLVDTEVLALAVRVRAVLITSDKEFGELVFRQRKAMGGVLLLRIMGLSSEDKLELVSSVVREHGKRLSGAFSVLSPRAIRIRPGSRR